MLRFFSVLLLVGFGISLPSLRAELPAQGLFARTNLVAWCIVPFDTRKRSPEERAAMLERLELRRLAYDWRSEHLPTFDAEVAALQKHGIELTAWWFPAALNDEAKAILACLERHRLHPQLWVTMGTEPEPDPAKLAQKLDGAVNTLAPICDAAAKLGSTVALYNHLGWFGEPTNQVALIRRLHSLGHTNVGSVYNFHHAHAHIDDFADQLRLLKPYLLAINLNGMVWEGDRQGKKIIPLGTGDEELNMLRVLNASGWFGPVGVIGHTEEDVEVKLTKELAGLTRLAPQATQPPRAQPPVRGAVLAAAKSVGEPPASGREPASQGEKDWVDNRWQRTDIGRFLASNVRLPDGSTVAKGLSIRLGESGDATVLYDSANATYRAAWTGGFLQFDPTRFGLIGTPKPAGNLVVSFPPQSNWPKTNVRFRGFHIQGPRTVLEYDVNGVGVQEMPWADPTPAGIVFLRDFALAARKDVLTLTVAPPFPPNSAAGVATESAETTSNLSGRSVRMISRQMWTNSGQVHLTTVLGKVTKTTTGDAGFQVEIPSSDRPTLLCVASWTGAANQLEAYLAWEAKNVELYDLAAFMTPGPKKWAELKTVGQRGPETDSFAVDTLTLPYDNPFHALLFGSGVDFAPDGTGYFCTIHGDVWRVTGVDESLRELTWQRFATGLFQPLGLKVRDGKVYVLGRDRITELTDENGDGEADTYRSFFDGIQTSTGGHDYVTCLEKDDVGRFYYTDPQGVHRVAADGRSSETLGTGFRNPNGMGVSPDGRVVTVAPQQGTWTPSSQIAEIKPGGYYGFGGPHKSPTRPLGYDAPLLWIPHSVDNSSGSQVWVPSGQWGPLGGQMLHLLWGRCGAMLVLRDTGVSPGEGDLTARPALQGAVVPLPLKFLSGPNRGSFRASDGHLYIAGSTGWQTSALKDGALQRVRYTGKIPRLPTGIRVQPDRVELAFSVPLDASTAADVGSYALSAWNYRYAEDYGSKDWSVAHPDREGHDTLVVKSARLLDDGRTVVLDVPGLPAAMQLELKYNLDAADRSRAVSGSMWFTVNPR